MLFNKKTNKLYIDLGSYSYKYLLRIDNKFEKGEEKFEEEILKGTFSNIEIDFDKLETVFKKKFGKLKAEVFIMCPDQFSKLLYMKLSKNMTEKIDRQYTLFRIRKNLDKSVGREVYIDYVEHELPENENGDIHLNVFIARNELLKGFNRIFSQGKLNFAGLLSTSSSVINSLFKEDKNDFALINIGFEATTVSIVNKGIMHYQRVIEIAGKNFLETIKNELSISEIEAEELLKNDLTLPNLSTDLESSLRDFALSRKLFSRLMDEITMTFKFYSETYRIAEIPQIYICGGLSEIKGMEEFFTEVFNIPSEKLVMKKENMEFAPAGVALANFV